MRGFIMSKYPIQPMQQWSYYAFAVVAGCMKEISSVNPGVWSGLVYDPNNNGLGLLLHNPGADVMNYASAHYPQLTYNDGLVQIEYFLHSAPWIYETVDTWGSFETFLIGCTSDIQLEAEHFLYQIGWAQTRADAAQAAHDFFYTMRDLLFAYQYTDPYQFKRLKWASGNRQLTQSEITNNINILYAYSQGVVYKNIVWLLYNRKWWRGEL